MHPVIAQCVADLRVGAEQFFQNVSDEELRQDHGLPENLDVEGAWVLDQQTDCFDVPEELFGKPFAIVNDRLFVKGVVWMMECETLMQFEFRRAE